MFPGKRMEGRMGGDRVFARNLQVYRIDTRYNIVFVTGCVPGAKQVGRWVLGGRGLWTRGVLGWWRVASRCSLLTSHKFCLHLYISHPGPSPLSLW